MTEKLTKKIDEKLTTIEYEIILIKKLSTKWIIKKLATFRYRNSQ
jgi:hypothetical protein